MSQPTPGPWVMDTEGSIRVPVRMPYGNPNTDEAYTVWARHDRGPQCIAICPGDSQEQADNARLIAQAPAMRDFVQKIVTDYEASLSRCSRYTREKAAHRPEPERIAAARALLAAIDA